MPTKTTIFASLLIAISAIVQLATAPERYDREGLTRMIERELARPGR